MSERLFQRMMAPLSRAVGNMLARGTVMLVNSATKMQTLQLKVLSGEAKEAVEHFEAYGLTSRPHPGSEAILMFFGGDRSHGITIMVADRRYRLKGLSDGEVALYDDLQQKVHLTRSGMQIHTPLDIDLRGNNVRLHAESSLIFECKGHGQKWFPDHVDTWQIGETAGTAHNLNGTQIP